jgi:hypothetical protein
MARRIIRKLSEACDKLPSSLFITGVTGKEEHPTFGGGYGDIFRATYDNRIVAMKYMRAVHFMRGADLRRIRLVSFQSMERMHYSVNVEILPRSSGLERLAPP